MLRKYATATILGAEIARPGGGLIKSAHRAVFNYEPRPGFLYARSRMISSRCNDNHDEFPAEEIRAAWKTAIGRPVFVNHVNEDHRRMRGVIIDAALHEDVLPDGRPDVWIEALHEIDARRFPKLAEAIIKGRVNRTSMGTDVGFSVCSACGNKASTPAEYCQHIPQMKGKILYRHTASGEREGHLIREICYKLGFFENSFLVEDPADPTAVVTGVDDRGLKATAAYGPESGMKEEPLFHDPFKSGEVLSWDAIGERHPQLYGDRDVHGEVAEGADGEGIGWAASHLAHSRPEDPEAEDKGSWDLMFHSEMVDPKHIDYFRNGRDDPRVRRAWQGYKRDPRQVPPLVLVHRHGVYQVADGHHRAEAAASAGRKVRAYVAYSPHPDEPSGDGDRAPYNGAEPHPGKLKPGEFPREASLMAIASSLPKIADYHVPCERPGCGMHWGPHGAAGLLIRHHDPEDGQTRYLLQKRAPWVDHGSTWGIPGGALHEDESPEEGAHREGEEEMGEMPYLQHHHTHTDDHGGWAYHTVIMDADDQFHPSEWDDESTGHAWFTKPEMKNLDLHPGFAQSLHQVTEGDGMQTQSSLPSIEIEAVRYDKPTDHPFFKDVKLSPKHIVAAYDEADEPTKAQGMRWYSDAHHIAKSLDPDGDAHRGAGVLAAYSPRTAWPINLFNASNTLRNRRAVRIGEGMNVMGQHAKAAAGVVEDGNHYFQVFKTPKITDFAHLIAHGGDDEGCKNCEPHRKPEYPKRAVVVDRHALSVAAGRRMTDNDIGRAPLGTRKFYEHVADQYRKAADQISKRDGTTVHPHQVQAITWLQQQKRNAAADAGESFGGRGRLTRDRNAWKAWEEHARGKHPDLMDEEGNIHVRNPHQSSLPSLAFRKGAPFAGYEDFEDCEEKNSDKDDPSAYCGEVKHRTEGSRSSLPSVLSYGETKAPADVDTLRTESCPVCGETDAFDGDRCQVCNFIQPPSMFTDPDTGVARQMDLRKDVMDAQQQVGPDGQPLPGQEGMDPGAVDPNDPTGQDPAMEGLPGQAGDQIADLFCPACGFSADTQEPMTNNDPSMPSEQQGLQEGDVCPNCGQATMLSPNDVGEMGGEVPQEIADDADADGMPDDQEPDVDADGIPDDQEADEDQDGRPDDSENDEDQDEAPDDADPDDDGDGEADAVEDEDEAPKGRKDNARRV